MAKIPKQIVFIYRSLPVLSVIHVIIPVIMWLNKSTLVASIKTSSPGLSKAQIASYTNIALNAGIVFHLIFAFAFIIMAKPIFKGSKKARTRLTIWLVINSLASLLSFYFSPMFRIVIPPLDVFQLLLVVILWMPRPSQSFFKFQAGQARD
ncbi:hypothetical protein [Alicyclobacillus fastidiosus]|uniref:DUF2306 domain-containing protein n=1 Tax=Alicyclobacillus fastidiosus TaxID=392011 RepID=A0ABV5AM19_9BACL|nr:hypothetical protein [Alicyclobacillus fastidiosus]WEH08429.1 hypothetical protein PYS47_17270 [Alicyclobacillus fastidiosus]